MKWLVQTATGVRIRVRVTPRASRTEIIGAEEEWLRVRLQAPPVDGKANQALCRFFAKQLKLPNSAVTLDSGSSSRLKQLHLTGITRKQILLLLS